MQREDVERLLERLRETSWRANVTDTLQQRDRDRREAADLIEALTAERDALRAAIFGGTDYATDLTNGNFIEMAQTTEVARLGALARAEKAEAERDAAFAAGQEEMRERAAKAVNATANMTGTGPQSRTVDALDVWNAIRDLPIKP